MERKWKITFEGDLSDVKDTFWADNNEVASRT
jgi:hypothetical protein